MNMLALESYEPSTMRNSHRTKAYAVKNFARCLGTLLSSRIFVHLLVSMWVECLLMEEIQEIAYLYHTG